MLWCIIAVKLRDFLDPASNYNLDHANRTPPSDTEPSRWDEHLSVEEADGISLPAIVTMPSDSGLWHETHTIAARPGNLVAAAYPATMHV